MNTEVPAVTVPSGGPEDLTEPNSTAEVSVDNSENQQTPRGCSAPDFHPDGMYYFPYTKSSTKLTKQSSPEF